MGRVKEHMLEMEALEHVATDLLVKTGALTRCPIHGVAMDNYDGEAVKQAYAIGTNMVKSGEVDARREDFMDAIKNAHENSAMDCGYCEKHRDE